MVEDAEVSQPHRLEEAEGAAEREHLVDDERSAVAVRTQAMHMVVRIQARCELRACVGHSTCLPRASNAWELRPEGEVYGRLVRVLRRLLDEARAEVRGRLCLESRLG